MALFSPTEKHVWLHLPTVLFNEFRKKTNSIQDFVKLGPALIKFFVLRNC